MVESGCISKLEAMALSERLDIRYEKKEDTGMTLRVSDLRKCKNRIVLS